MTYTMFNKNFASLFLSSLVSTLGGSLSYIAIYWNFSEAKNLTLLSLLTTCYFLSRFVFSLFLSPISDMYDSHWLMKNSMLIRGLLLLLVGGVIYFFHISYSWILLVVIFQTAVESVYFPSASKFVLKIVDKANLSRANAILQTLDNIGSLVGLAVGGVAVMFLSLGSLLSIEGFAYLVGALFVTLIPSLTKDSREVGKRTNFFAVWKEGLHYIFRHKWLFAVLGIAIFANLAIAPTITLLAPYASDVLKGSSSTFSSLEIASVIGSILTGMLLSKVQVKRLSFMFVLAASLQALVMILLGFNHDLPIAWVLLACVGFAIGLFNTPFVTLLQRFVPVEMLGRVRGSLVAASKLASSLGYFFSGVVSDHLGISHSMILFGVLGMVGILVIAVMRPFTSIATHQAQASA